MFSDTIFTEGKVLGGHSLGTYVCSLLRVGEVSLVVPYADHVRDIGRDWLNLVKELFPLCGDRNCIYKQHLFFLTPMAIKFSCQNWTKNETKPWDLKKLRLWIFWRAHSCSVSFGIADVSNVQHYIRLISILVEESRGVNGRLFRTDNLPAIVQFCCSHI